MFRTLLLVRQARRELKLLVHPSAVIPIRIGGAVDPRARGALGAGVHLPVFRHDPRAHVRAARHRASTWCRRSRRPWARSTTSGPGLGAVGPSTNFAALSDAQTWICTLAMLIGRLEIFSVLVLFTATLLAEISDADIPIS